MTEVLGCPPFAPKATGLLLRRGMTRWTAKRHQRFARDAEQRTSCRPPSIETVIGHAAVIFVGVIAPPRSANVRPVIVVAVALQPPWGGIPPSAVVVRITAPTVPVPSVVCAKDLHPPLRVNFGRMLAKRGMLHDLRTDAALPCCSVLLLNDARADAVLWSFSIVLNGTRVDAVLGCCPVFVLNATVLSRGACTTDPKRAVSPIKNL